LKRRLRRVPDSRTSAHLIGWLNPMNSLSDAHRFQGNNARSNSEADTGHRKPKRTPYRRDMQTSVRQNRPNRPHISSDTSHVKEQETKPPECAKSVSATQQFYLNILASQPVGALPDHPVWRAAARLSASVAVLFTDSAARSQPLFPGFVMFFTYALILR